MGERNYIFPVFNILEGVSDGDSDHYTNIRKSLDSIFSKQWEPNSLYQRSGCKYSTFPHNVAYSNVAYTQDDTEDIQLTKILCIFVETKIQK
jgi:hypothetical protein